MEAFNAKVAKYDSEKAEIKQKAEQLENERDAARAVATSASEHGGGMAIAIFQISIALASICMVTKKRPLWYVSLVLAALATAKMVFVWLK